MLTHWVVGTHNLRVSRRRKVADPFEELARAVERRRPELHVRLRDDVEARVPDFRFTDDDAERRAERLRDDVIDGVLAAVVTGEVGDVSFNQDLGRSMAAAGLPLEHHFTAHRTAYPFLLTVLLEEAERGGRSDLAAEVARRHAGHASAVTEAYVAGYVEARAVLELDGERRVRAVYESLLHTDADWPPHLENQAATYGLGRETLVVVVVLTWEGLPSGLTPELVRRRLGGWLKLAPSTPLLIAGAGIEGLAAPGGRPGVVVETLRRGVARLLADGVVGLRCGVSTAGPARDVGVLHRQATVARGVAGPGYPVVTLAEVEPITYLASTSHPDAVLVVSDGVRRLHQGQERTTPSWRDVLDQWRRFGSVTRVAEELHCHPNTVLNRFRTVEAITGLDPRHPGDLLGLVSGLAILDRHAETDHGS